MYGLDDCDVKEIIRSPDKVFDPLGKLLKAKAIELFKKEFYRLTGKKLPNVLINKISVYYDRHPEKFKDAYTEEEIYEMLYTWHLDGSREVW